MRLSLYVGTGFAPIWLGLVCPEPVRSSHTDLELAERRIPIGRFVVCLTVPIQGKGTVENEMRTALQARIPQGPEAETAPHPVHPTRRQRAGEQK